MTVNAAAGWLAPSDTVYSFLPDPDAPPPVRYCPDWSGPDEFDCRPVWTNEDTWDLWHDCEDELAGPHDVCNCEKCGATRPNPGVES